MRIIGVPDGDLTLPALKHPALPQINLKGLPATSLHFAELSLDCSASGVVGVTPLTTSSQT